MLYEESHASGINSQHDSNQIVHCKREMKSCCYMSIIRAESMDDSVENDITGMSYFVILYFH